MISTAGYYCTRGHVWEVTTNTFMHEQIQKSPCPHCLEEIPPAEYVSVTAPVGPSLLGTVHGPFPDRAVAERVMVRHEAERASVAVLIAGEISGEQETYESLAAKRDHHEDMVKVYNRRIDALLRESREREEAEERHRYCSPGAHHCVTLS